ncbi:MAG TPA: hypothetical protein VJT49_24755 [Amycolatopsis sp.]|uniref:hypothetical protein n=1 Tax=Amycolatopsis sp. TaxID=37632 RepID=UPI002B49202E|nr:hypothetical protein [Amycolatopsis sp.]HKS48261.1 hypothetical protein [Amycolatopsis sp.]
MTGFLAKLGEKLAERWVAQLALPGALFLAVAGLGIVLGHGRALRADQLGPVAEKVSTGLGRAPVALVLGAVALLLAAFGVGLFARAAGSAVERLWLIDSPNRLVAPFVTRRRNRWGDAHDDYRNATQEPAEPAADFERRRGELAAARNRISLAAPSHPTWIGDRVNAAHLRVLHEYGLDLAAVWPRLWLLVPEETRVAVREARSSFTDAAVLSGWGLMYFAVGVALWWPAVLAGVALTVMGQRRGREAAGTFADLVESTVDLHCAELAEKLRIPLGDDRVTEGVGQQISERLRKGA